MMHRPVDSFPPDSGSIRRARCFAATCARARSELSRRVQRESERRRKTERERERTLLNRAVVNRRKLTARTSHLHTIEIRAPYTAAPLSLFYFPLFLARVSTVRRSGGRRRDVHLPRALTYAAVCFHKYARFEQ